MLVVPANEWGLIIHSTADGTRPTSATGASVTPAQNAYGAYTTLIAGASLTDDCYEIELCINDVGVGSAARDCVVSLGTDPSGGTSFTSLADLVCGPATFHTTLSGGTWYRFPLFIKAGTSIGVAAAVNSATLTAINVFCRVKCRPSRPEAIKVGTFISQFGVTLATSSGTAITEGTTTDGAWTQLGAALTKPCWYWEFGYGCNNATMNAGIAYVDLGIGDGVNFKIAISNAPIMTSASEQVSKAFAGAYARAAVGDGVYARSQSSTSNAGVSIAAYGVGG